MTVFQHLANKRWDGTPFRKAGVLLIFAIAILFLYALSLGPVLHLCGARSYPNTVTLPQWVKVLYYPILNGHLGPFDLAYHRYLLWWTDVN